MQQNRVEMIAFKMAMLKIQKSTLLLNKTVMILFSALFHLLYAQSTEIIFDHLSLEHGLSQSSVYTIIQDSQGFMWFGSEDGLNQYDGYQFKISRNDPENPNTLGANTIFEIFEDTRGDLWIGTWNGGLNKYNRDTNIFTSYKHDPSDSNSIGSDIIYSIYEDKSGVLWIGTGDGGLNRFDKQKNVFKSLNGTGLLYLKFYCNSDFLPRLQGISGLGVAVTEGERPARAQARPAS